MQKQTRSLLQELEEMAENRDINHIIESRGHNVITSAINLLEMIQKYHGDEQLQVLERKLLNAIRSRDHGKFSKMLRKQQP